MRTLGFASLILAAATACGPAPSSVDFGHTSAALGTVTSATLTTNGKCSGLSDCYALKLSGCSTPADISSNGFAWVHLRFPTVARKGSVVGTTGSEAQGAFAYGFYDVKYGGLRDLLLGQGLMVASVAFDNGNGTTANNGINWTSASPSSANGTLNLICRYATIANWIYTTKHCNGSSCGDSANLPFGATGNSAGGATIAWALAWWGATNIFDKVVLTGGPPQTHADRQCSQTISDAAPMALKSAVRSYYIPPPGYGISTCTLASLQGPGSYAGEWQGYNGGAASTDPHDDGWDSAWGYPDTSADGPCHHAQVNQATTSDLAKLQGDGILSSGFAANSGKTDLVHMVGENDSTIAPQSGYAWGHAGIIGYGGASAKPICVPGSSHNVPASTNGPGLIAAEFDTASGAFIVHP